jgi:hypothetical protein
MQIPFHVVGTFAGVKPGGEATRDGVKFDWGPKPQFLIVQPDGSADLWPIREADLDEAGEVDWRSLSPGDPVELEGSAWLGDGDRPGFLRVSACRHASKTKPAA